MQPPNTPMNLHPSIIIQAVKDYLNIQSLDKYAQTLAALLIVKHSPEKQARKVEGIYPDLSLLDSASFKNDLSTIEFSYLV
jgi:hypothetical protein